MQKLRVGAGLLFVTVAVFALAVTAVVSAASATRTDPLPPSEVFMFKASAEGRTVRAVYEFPEHYYLYRERFMISADTVDFEIVEVRYPPALVHDDPFFGPTEIYKNGLTLEIDVSGEGEYQLNIVSQGCDELLGICYPPQTHVAMLIAEDGDDGVGGISNIRIDVIGDNAQDAAASAAQLISDKNLLAIMIAFFGFGLLLSFTPCVLPMLPILLGIIGGNSGKQRAMTSTAAYISGVVVTYTGLGVFAGLSGQLLAPFLQQPPVLLVSSAVLLALAVSMFGGYDIRPPAFRHRAESGSGGAFMMGALSAAVVSPCVAAPLVGALIYIGNTGDAWIGGAALFSLSLGMSALLAVAGVGGAHILPRAGEWTNDIKLVLGALLCGAAAWVSSSLLPASAVMLIYGALLLFCGVVMFSAHIRVIKTAAIMVLLWGGAIIVGAAGGGKDPLSPLASFVSNGELSTQPAPEFSPVASYAELQRTLGATSRPVMLEFYADWCISCKEMERFTFTDPKVRAKMDEMLLLRADVTAIDEHAKTLLNNFGLYGPPAILFFTSQGVLISTVRVTGYQSPQRFLRTLNALDARGV